MRAAFFVLALSSASLCLALIPTASGVAGRIGLALLALAAAGFAIAGLFAPSRAGGLHDLGAMLDQLPLAAPLISWSLSRNIAWHGAKRTLLLTALVPLLGLAIFIAAMLVMLPGKDSGPGPNVVIGWPNRIMILAQCAWLIPVAWLTIRAGPLSSADAPAQNASVPPMRGPLGSET